MTNPTTEVRAHLVQFARGWPSADAGWTTLRWRRATIASEGAGQIQGDAVLEQVHGVLYDEQLAQVLSLGVSPNVNRGSAQEALLGCYVRVLIEDPAGTITIGALTWSPLWHGVYRDEGREPDGDREDPGGIATWRCVGPSEILDQIYITRGFEKSVGGFCNPHFCPVFNDTASGDMDPLLTTINGVSVHVHLRNGSGSPWWVRHVIELLLAGFATPNVYGMPDTEYAGGLKWQLSAASGLLDYPVERLDLNGKTVCQALNLLCNPSRGTTWSISISGQLATITVLPVNDTAVTIGAANIPAATPITFDWRDSVWIQEPRYAADHEQYDAVIGSGGRPLVSLTLWMTVAGGVIDPASSILPDGWTLASTPGDTPTDDFYFRRFKLNPAWLGQQYLQATNGLRMPTLLGSDPPDGSRSWTSVVPSSQALKIERYLPCAQGFGTSLDAPRQMPVVVIGRGVTWVDYSAKVSVTPTCGPAGLILGSNVDDAELIRSEMGTNGTLLVTVGIYEWSPLVVGWVADRATWPRDVPRILGARQDNYEQGVLLAHTVKGVNAIAGQVGALLTTGGADASVYDYVPSLQAHVGLLVSRFSKPGGMMSFTQRGTIDRDPTKAPGAYVAGVIVGDSTLPVNGTISRRIWNLTREAFGTSWSSERPRPSIESSE